jgi:hypothetical protein
MRSGTGRAAAQRAIGMKTSAIINKPVAEYEA